MHRRVRPGRRPRTRRLVAAVAALTAVAVGASCTPGSPTQGSETPRQPRSAVSTDPSKAGKVTLTVWDQEVRGSQNVAMTNLNNEFMKKYPNITIKRVAKSFTDLKTTLKLALSDDNPPDVVQANQGYPDMGTFVDAGMLQRLDPYANAYGWRKRYSKTLLDLNSFTPNGKQFGQGYLYGISQTGEIVGVYYNKKKLAALGLAQPKTWGEFTKQLATIKSKGELPIMFGNKDAFPAIHTYGMIQNRTNPQQEIVDTVFTRPGKKWDTTGNENAAATMQDWVEKGYFSEGANGLGYDQAAADFANGKGVFLMTGTWLYADLAKTMKKDLGFMPPPPVKAGGVPYATGGQGLSWSITSRSEHSDVAGAYLDFITSPHAADVVTKAGGLPAIAPESAKPEAGTALAQIFTEWTRLNDANGLVPYLDYTTPNFYDTLSVQLQRLIGEKATPQQCIGEMQKDYGDFQAHK
ncbi:MAG: extracellular solute-binding protein [Streptosporangiales bacterium]|nr:extracellular solute-binding protein [Streptosporangiales bacterium]